MFQTTSTTLLERAKRVYRQAAHNWRLIQNFSPKNILMPSNTPFIRRKTPNPFFLKAESKLWPVEIKSFESDEELTAICVRSIHLLFILQFLKDIREQSE